MNTKLGRVAIYFRVSTDKQDHQLQKDEVYHYLDALGDDRPAGRDIKHFTDTVSGKSRNRPAFDQMIRECKDGKFQTILVYKLDRFSRSMNDCLTTVLDLNECGIGFIAATQPEFNTQTGIYKTLLVAILSFVADLESTMISERTKAGLASAKKRGVRLGRKNHLIDPHKITNITNCLNAGWKVPEICLELKVSTHSVYKIKREIAQIAHTTGEIAG